MKRLLIFIVLMCVPTWAFGAEISVYSVDVYVQDNGDLLVRENIVYSPGDKKVSSWTRTIPLRFQSSSLDSRQMMTVSAVSARRNGIAEKATLNASSRTASVVVGDGLAIWSGIQNLEIEYLVTGALRYFDAYNQVYWQAVPSDLTETVQQFAGSINVPKQYRVEEVNCGVGTGQEEVASRCNIAPRIDGGYTGYYAHSNLSPGQHIFIDAQFETGVRVNKITAKLTWWEQALILAGGILALLLLLLLIRLVYYKYMNVRYAKKFEDK